MREAETFRRARKGRKFADSFLQSANTFHAWSLFELYERPTKWARVFKERRAGVRTTEAIQRLRRQMIEVISIRSPLYEAIRDGD